MASPISLKRRRFLTPPKPDAKSGAQTNLGEGIPTEKRIGTVYDAVAGRISNAGFIPALPFVSQTRDTASSSTLAAAPEAVLFRRKRAPERYEESDSYFANESLPPGHLPESDLLKALHCYASDFYSRATPNECTHDWRSMDETALLAFGILMEEICRKELGETGDLVFVEGEDEAPKASEKTAPAPALSGRADSVVARNRRRKRRRLGTPDTVDDQG